jgi:hypothetical protein
MKAIYFAVIIACGACISNRNNSLKENQDFFLSAGNYKFWDSSVGYNLLFYKDSSKVIEFFYEKNSGKRISANYGDFMVDFFYWELNNDTLYIRPSPEVFPQKFLVLYISEDSLALFDFKKSWGWGSDTLYFKKSKDQTMFPIKQ